VELNIANAFVTRLPENFGQLQNLERLDLHNNQISWLPSSFVHLIKLEVINTCRCHMTKDGHDWDNKILQHSITKKSVIQ
jgi:Leucine-rich repeat (LRR) protein